MMFGVLEVKRSFRGIKVGVSRESCFGVATVGSGWRIKAQSDDDNVEGK